VGARSCEIEVVERIPVWRNERRIGDAVGILPDRCFGREESTERLPVRLRRLSPVGSDRVPAVAQPFLVGVAILRDDRCNALWIFCRHSKTCRRTVVEYVDRKTVEADNFGKAIDYARNMVERIVELVAARHVRLAKPGKIRRDNMKFPREPRDEGTEHMTRARKSVKQQQRRRIGSARLAGVYLQPVDVSPAVIDRGHELPLVSSRA